jgi:hypothetical protein
MISALASVLSTALTIGAVLALADHYSEEAQWASARPVAIAQR